MSAPERYVVVGALALTALGGWASAWHYRTALVDVVYVADRYRSNYRRCVRGEEPETDSIRRRDGEAIAYPEGAAIGY